MLLSCRKNVSLEFLAVFLLYFRHAEIDVNILFITDSIVAYITSRLLSCLTLLISYIFSLDLLRWYLYLLTYRLNNGGFLIMPGSTQRLSQNTSKVSFPVGQILWCKWNNFTAQLRSGKYMNPSCILCFMPSTLEGSIHRSRKVMLFMFQKTNHVNDSYFCMVDVTRYNISQY